MKRWARWLLVAFLLLVAALGCVVFWPDHVSLENCRRIRPGMTDADVTAILGRADNDPSGDEPLAPSWNRVRVWTGKHGVIEVQSIAGSVASRRYGRPAGFAWLHRLKSWLGIPSEPGTINFVDLPGNFFEGE